MRYPARYDAFFPFHRRIEQLRIQINDVFQPPPVMELMIPVDIRETPEAYRVLALLPGVEKERITVEIEENRLYLAAEFVPAPPEASEKLLINEFPAGTIRRTLAFGEPLDARSIEARYENGILALIIPKQTTKNPNTGG